MISCLLPSNIAVVEATGPLEGERLLGEEAHLVARAVPKRRAEFTTSRECARRALSRIGVPPRPVLAGPNGEPLWPDGIVGSITHCDGYRGCAVGRSTEFITVGIDAEPDVPLPSGVLEVVASARELRHLTALHHRSTQASWDRLLFSAKEAVYKAWFPMTGAPLEPRDIELTIAVTTQTFSACLPYTPARDQRRPEYRGRWCVSRGLLFTAVVVAA